MNIVEVEKIDKTEKWPGRLALILLVLFLVMMSPYELLSYKDIPAWYRGLGGLIMPLLLIGVFVTSILSLVVFIQQISKFKDFFSYICLFVLSIDILIIVFLLIDLFFPSLGIFENYITFGMTYDIFKFVYWIIPIIFVPFVLIELSLFFVKKVSLKARLYRWSVALQVFVIALVLTEQLLSIPYLIPIEDDTLPVSTELQIQQKTKFGY